jgi:hypothetical protein
MTGCSNGHFLRHYATVLPPSRRTKAGLEVESASDSSGKSDREDVEPQVNIRILVMKMTDVAVTITTTFRTIANARVGLAQLPAPNGVPSSGWHLPLLSSSPPSLPQAEALSSSHPPIHVTPSHDSARLATMLCCAWKLGLFLQRYDDALIWAQFIPGYADRDSSTAPSILGVRQEMPQCSMLGG